MPCNPSCQSSAIHTMLLRTGTLVASAPTQVQTTLHIHLCSTLDLQVVGRCFLTRRIFLSGPDLCYFSYPHWVILCIGSTHGTWLLRISLLRESVMLVHLELQLQEQKQKQYKCRSGSRVSTFKSTNELCRLFNATSGRGTASFFFLYGLEV